MSYSDSDSSARTSWEEDDVIDYIMKNEIKGYTNDLFEPLAKKFSGLTKNNFKSKSFFNNFSSRFYALSCSKSLKNSENTLTVMFCGLMTQRLKIPHELETTLYGRFELYFIF